MAEDFSSGFTAAVGLKLSLSELSDHHQQSSSSATTTTTIIVRQNQRGSEEKGQDQEATERIHQESERFGIASSDIKKQENGVESATAADASSAIKIELVDETALIETDITSFTSEKSKKKKKRARRRVEGEKNREKDALATKSKIGGNILKSGKMVYTRKELEGLRFVGLEAQMKKWVEVYCGLGPLVAKEYDSLVADSNHHHHHHHDQNRQKSIRGKYTSAALIFGEDSIQNTDDKTEGENTLGSASAFPATGESNCSILDSEQSEDYDSEEEYSIQRPAFLVTGEPNFDSGPPQDGLEYLRRVRWEAAQIPKVKVAKVECSKLNKEQAVYMPEFPEIAKCQERLLPLKHWEEAFLADFEELRLALAFNGDYCAKMSGKLRHELDFHRDTPESLFQENFDNLAARGNGCQLSCRTQPLAADENAAPRLLESSSPSSALSADSDSGPTLSVILPMEPVTRVSLLRKRISSAETVETLSREDCLWLFSLCAAVDCPLDADTCAAIRSLLRKCASLRAQKSEADDELVMLNILTTICGRYFGQSEV